MINQEYPFNFAPTKKLGGGWIAYKGGGSDPPEAPDYTAAANATAAGNLDAAKYATEANRVNQYTPWGSLEYTQDQAPSFDQAGYDADWARYEKEKAAYDAVQRNPYQNSPGRGYRQDATGWYNPLRPDENGGVQYVQYNSQNNGMSAPVAPDRAKYTIAGGNKWSQTTKLSPELQAALDSQIAVTKGKSQSAEQLLKILGTQLQTPFDFSSLPEYAKYDPNNGDAYARAAYNKQYNLLQPAYEQADTQLRNKLALQGLSNTSEAFGTDVGNLNRSKNEALRTLADASYSSGNKAAIDEYNTAMSGRGQQLAQMLSQYNMPLNQLNALLSGSQVQSPTFQGYAQQGQTAGPDLLGAANAQYSNAVGAYNADQASNASANAGLGQILGTIGGAAIMASDRRLKTDIKQVDTLPNGLGVYKYTYRWDKDTVHTGVMADEVEALIPEAVFTLPSGYKAVNYSHIFKETT